MGWLNQVFLGMEVQIKTNVPRGWETFPYLLGGGPLLLNYGRDVLDAELEGFSGYFAAPNARTAVGRTAAGKNLIIVVDKAGGAGGCTWEELTIICRDLLDCTEAMGFDGGGSSTMFVGDEVVNQPSAGGQREVANILAVVPYSSFI
jgi:exopolysaccharide biosynthesis protein